MMCQMIGFPPISIMGLGFQVRFLADASAEPPASMTSFIINEFIV